MPTHSTILLPKSRPREQESTLTEPGKVRDVIFATVCVYLHYILIFNLCPEAHKAVFAAGFFCKLQAWFTEALVSRGMKDTLCHFSLAGTVRFHISQPEFLLFHFSKPGCSHPDMLKPTQTFKSQEEKKHQPHCPPHPALALLSGVQSPSN